VPLITPVDLAIRREQVFAMARPGSPDPGPPGRGRGVLAVAAGSGDPAGAGVRHCQAGVGGVWRWPPDLAIQREQVFAHGSAEGVLDSFPAFLNAL